MLCEIAIYAIPPSTVGFHAATHPPTMTTSPDEAADEGKGSSNDEEAIDAAVAFVTQRYRAPLTASEKIQVLQAWNIASEAGADGAFCQALLLEWRLLCAEQEQEDSNGKLSKIARAPTQTTGTTSASSHWAQRRRRRSSNRNRATRQVEGNKDPLYAALDARIGDAPHLLLGLLDGALRKGLGSTCVEHNLRSGPLPLEEEIHLLKHKRLVADNAANTLKLECETVADYLKLFARCGVRPRHWLALSEAFEWAMETHGMTGGALEQHEHHEHRFSSSPFARAVAQKVVLPALDDIRELQSLAAEPAFRVVLPRFWGRLSPTDAASFGELFYRRLLTKNPSLLDYFSKTDMDSLSVHLMMALDLVVQSVGELGSDSTSPFRASLNHLGEMHRKVGVPTYSYALVGGMLIQCLQPLFQAEEELLTKTLQKRTRFGARSYHRPNRLTQNPSGTGGSTKRKHNYPKEGKPSFWSALRSCCRPASRDENENEETLVSSPMAAPINEQMLDGSVFEGADSSNIQTNDGGSSNSSSEEEDASLKATASDMTAVFTRLYVEVMSIVYYPMLKEEKLVDSAKQFYEVMKTELQWSEDRFRKRMDEVEHDIKRTGAYHQTTEEIAVGARCAWRNSATCLGRESWDALIVRDSRHIGHPQKIFEDVQEHMRIATDSRDIQPVMTIYRPKQPDEAIGARFWSASLGGYAAYTDEESDMLIGDPET